PPGRYLGGLAGEAWCCHRKNTIMATMGRVGVVRSGHSIGAARMLSCFASGPRSPHRRRVRRPRRETADKGPSIMGFEDEVDQSVGRPCRQCDGRFKRTHELTSSIVPRGTSFHRGVELDFLLLHWILHRSQAAATSLVHRNSVPSTHTRCMITANRRASATIAFFIPRCLATFIAQALSQDHFVERTSMLWAAS